MTLEEAIQRCQALAAGNASLTGGRGPDAVAVGAVLSALKVAGIKREALRARVAVLGRVARAADAVDRTRHRNHGGDEATCPVCVPQRELAEALAAYRAGLDAPAPEGPSR